MLKIENLHFDFDGFEVLRNVSFNVERGQVCALLGPNGTGKTTLLKCIARLFNYGRGNVLVENEDIGRKKIGEIARLIAYVPQEHKPPFPYLVKEVVLMGRTPHMGGVFGPTEKDIKLAIRSMELVGIENLADRPYTNLSGGQRQLVIIARAITQSPKILLLDEPTSNLDFRNQIKIWNLVRELARKEDLTVVGCTHDPNHVLWFCDKVVILGDDGIIANGTPTDVINNEILNKIYDNTCDVRCLDDIHMVVPNIA